MTVFDRFWGQIGGSEFEILDIFRMIIKPPRGPRNDPKTPRNRPKTAQKAVFDHFSDNFRYTFLEISQRILGIPIFLGSEFLWGFDFCIGPGLSLYLAAVRSDHLFHSIDRVFRLKRLFLTILVTTSVTLS